MQVIDFVGLTALARESLARPTRQIIALIGPPASGKSTLAEALREALPAGSAEILPMDGFHYDDAVLEAMGRRPWKGAPDTFDVGGLASALARLRDPAQGAVAVPVFDRALEISRGSARLIGADVPLIIVEGNYLLLEADPWSALAPLFDLTVMIEVPETVLRERLAARWEGFGLSPEQIAFKLEQNDLPNGRLVSSTSRAADYRLG